MSVFHARIASMEAGGLVCFGLYACGLWALAVYYNRLPRWPMPWDRWFRTTPAVDRVMRMVAFVFAIVVTLVFLAMLLESR